MQKESAVALFKSAPTIETAIANLGYKTTTPCVELAQAILEDSQFFSLGDFSKLVELGGAIQSTQVEEIENGIYKNEYLYASTLTKIYNACFILLFQGTENSSNTELENPLKTLSRPHQLALKATETANREMLILTSLCLLNPKNLTDKRVIDAAMSLTVLSSVEHRIILTKMRCFPQEIRHQVLLEVADASLINPLSVVSIMKAIHLMPKDKLDQEVTSNIVALFSKLESKQEMDSILSLLSQLNPFDRIDSITVLESIVQDKSISLTFPNLLTFFYTKADGHLWIKFRSHQYLLAQLNSLGRSEAKEKALLIKKDLSSFGVQEQDLLFQKVQSLLTKQSQPSSRVNSPVTNMASALVASPIVAARTLAPQTGIKRSHSVSFDLGNINNNNDTNSN